MGCPTVCGAVQPGHYLPGLHQKRHRLHLRFSLLPSEHLRHGTRVGISGKRNCNLGIYKNIGDMVMVMGSNEVLDAWKRYTEQYTYNNLKN